jgi:pantoate kinase
MPVTTASGKGTGGTGVGVTVGEGTDVGVTLGEGRGVGLTAPHPATSATATTTAALRNVARIFTALS